LHRLVRQIAINITLGDMTTAAVFAGLEHYPGFTEMLTRRYEPKTGCQ
jgi:hypothetical protein